jgi:uncharacterized membrane protein YfcA
MQVRPTGKPTWLALLFAVLLTLWLAVPAFAQDDDEDEEPGAFREYLSERGNNFKGGLNGFLTWPADPVMCTTEAKELFEGWWPPFNYVTAFFAGTFQGLYRMGMGTFDMVFAPVPYMPMLSPVPRYKIVPFYHEDE